MEHRLNAIEDARENFCITDVTGNELRARVDIGEPGATMHLRDLGIEDAHAMTLLEQSVREVGTDESGASSNQYVQFLRLGTVGKIAPRFAGARTLGNCLAGGLDKFIRLR